MREMLLLGAGASVEADVPAAIDMTAKIVKGFEERRHQWPTEWKALSFVIGGLLMNQGVRESNPLECGVNVEDLFNAIQTLARRDAMEVLPFIGSWHPRIDELDREDSMQDVDRMQRALFKSINEAYRAGVPSQSHSINRRIDEAVRAVVDNSLKGRLSSSTRVGEEVENILNNYVKEWMRNSDMRFSPSSAATSSFRAASEALSNKGRVFDRVATRMVSMLKKHVYVRDSSKVQYLRPVSMLSDRQGSLTIATLNYDNCMELACSASERSCTTGIESWSRSSASSDPFVCTSGILLLKLHGSINWTVKRSGNKSVLPHHIIELLSDEDMEKDGGTYQPAVIFGQRNKLTAEGPYLDIFRAFQRELSASNRLTVAGYSFGDEHINIYLSQWLNADQSRKIRIVDPSFDRNQRECARMLRDSKSEQVEIVRMGAGEAFEKFWGRE